jgi:hypothetical protein
LIKDGEKIHENYLKKNLLVDIEPIIKSPEKLESFAQENFKHRKKLLQIKRKKKYSGY